MDAVHFLREKERMMREDPKAYGKVLRLTLFSSVVKEVAKWSKSHPKKTRAQDFFEKHPNAPKNIYGMPKTCAEECGYCRCRAEHAHEQTECAECWRKPI